MNEVKNWAYRNLKGDPVIWFIVLILSLFSILVVYSATGSLAYKMRDGHTEYYLIKHSVLVVVSLMAIWLAHRIDYRYYSKISRLVLWLCVPLLLFTWMFGTNINEASRWLTIPVINQAFQPSDLAKLALLVTLASMLSKRQQSIDDFQKAIVPMLFWIGLICGLIALTNFSSAILLFLTCMLVLFIGRVPVKYLAMLVVICMSFGSVAFMVGQRGGTAISRVEDYINNDTPYQAKQAYIAIASGGVIGKGPGQSDQRNFLPHPYSDFIYAIILEEYGMIGGVLILFLYLALLYRGMKAAEQNDRAYGGLLSAGLSFALVIQALVNMGVAVGLGPVTGLTLPFISMGGTSQLFAGIALGIILSVSRGEIDKFGGSIGNQYKEAA
ncbi:FtsW/RodA/SpoVE family cell cycle protein [Ekhidna sp.]|uniref:FtsW/RodA/SpoVE family cell cycle protein n=1 Tax=Ekhidna sp. TaxID=2608089 RepID=UPI003B5BE64D